MLGRLTLIVVAACVLAGSAGAAATDPKKRHNGADQAWAGAIRIHRDDLGPGDWRVEAANDTGGTPRACKDPDLSDLVETGNAENPDFSRNGSFVGSAARIYQTEHQATLAWQRIVRQPVKRCLVDAFERALVGSGARLLVGSIEPTSTPQSFSARIRLTISIAKQQIAGRFSYHFFVRGRATAMLMVFSFSRPLTPIPESLERRLSALVLRRLQQR
jgi:hypothetical protein